MLTKSMARPSGLVFPISLLTLGLAMLLPYLIHFIPASGTPPVPTGAVLLPIFYAPLLALLLDYPLAALLASWLAPYLNHVLTDNPPTNEMTILLTLELTVFSLVVMLVYPRVSKSARWGLLAYGLAPIAYGVAKGVEYLFLLAQPDFILPSAGEYVRNSAQNALPGIIILAILNILTVLYLKKAAEAKK